jgi:hypothetical protein
MLPHLYDAWRGNASRCNGRSWSIFRVPNRPICVMGYELWQNATRSSLDNHHRCYCYNGSMVNAEKSCFGWHGLFGRPEPGN